MPETRRNSRSTRQHHQPASAYSANKPYRWGLIGFLLVCLLGAAVWRFFIFHPGTGSMSARKAAPAHKPELDGPLLAAIREGDGPTIQSLLENGADPNSRDDSGDPAVVLAVLFADTDILRLLLEHHADPNARLKDGANPLVRAAYHRDKVKLLLDYGAEVDNLAMVAAARVPGSCSTLELLLQYGGMGRAQVNGYTALMAAAGNGDLESVTFLIKHGAEANARTSNGCTALYTAAIAGNPEVISILLDHGGDPNVVCELIDTGGDIETPAMLAAAMRWTECLRRLIAKGASVNVQGGPFERTPLIVASTTGNEEIVRLLLDAGADAKAKDASADTSLDWAVRRGQTEIVKLLKQAGAEETQQPRRGEPVRLQQKIDGDSVQRAVAASMPLLQKSGRRMTQESHCVTCHQHSLVAMTVGLARQNGFKVDETIADTERAHVLDHVDRRVSGILMGTGIETTLAAYTLAAFAAESVPPNRETEALVHYFMARQRPDGRWQSENYRPPEDSSDFMNTALAIRGLAHYTPKGQKAEMNERMAKARAWLESSNPTEPAEQAFRLLGLGWVHADPARIKNAADSLVALQGPDGGWAQLPELTSDAYATGLILYALQESGAIHTDDSAYRRGVEYLLKTQLANGSWYVPTRCFPFVEFRTSGFPGGKSQFISAAATCYSTMALAASASPRAKTVASSETR
jgi:ankyrin repeat protein